MSLEGKIAVVTGGARGIGAGIVKALAAQGAWNAKLFENLVIIGEADKHDTLLVLQVAFNYASPSSEKAAEALIREIETSSTVTGGKAISIRADMASLEAPNQLISATLSGFNTDKIDMLINNAAVCQNTVLESITLEEYDSMMTVNVRAVIFMTQAILPHIRHGGRIVNLSSVSSRGGYATQTVYAATKAAIEAVTRVWATELGHKYGVTVNSVNPGPVDTDMYRAAGKMHLEGMEERNKKVPAAPRCGTVEDIADIVCFLCEERSRWVTGDTVCANGGMMYL